MRGESFALLVTSSFSKKPFVFLNLFYYILYFLADVFRYVFGEENEMWVYMSDFKKLRMAENWYFILDERIDCGKCVLFPIRVKFSVRKTARFYSEKLTVILSLEACDESTTLQERDLEDVLREQEVLREQDVGDME